MKAAAFAALLFATWTTPPQAPLLAAPTDRQAEVRLHVRADFAQVPDTARTEAQTTLEWVVRQRVERLGLPGIKVAREGDMRDRVTVVVAAGIDVNQVKTAITSTPLLEIRLVERGPASSRQGLEQGPSGVADADFEVLSKTELVETGHLRWNADGSPVRTVTGPTYVDVYYRVRRTPVATAQDIESVQTTTASDGTPAITLSFNDAAATRMEKATAENVGRLMALVVNGSLRLAPRIDAKLSHSAVIAGVRFTTDEAGRLAAAIRWRTAIESLTIEPAEE
jgi:preprotein translocase subunit SecD